MVETMTKHLKEADLRNEKENEKMRGTRGEGGEGGKERERGGGPGGATEGRK